MVAAQRPLFMDKPELLCALRHLRKARSTICDSLLLHQERVRAGEKVDDADKVQDALMRDISILGTIVRKLWVEVLR